MSLINKAEYHIINKALLIYDSFEFKDKGIQNFENYSK
jgi:hypothetical protein